mmetsp:Transcript_2110/g.5643  ORF Transcript_2110/g.5643 Transcript_2110/m.5643 type:complete len:303 (-) Transcript_2110:88-996(-)
MFSDTSPWIVDDMVACSSCSVFSFSFAANLDLYAASLFLSNRSGTCFTSSSTSGSSISTSGSFLNARLNAFKALSLMRRSLLLFAEPGVSTADPGVGGITSLNDLVLVISIVGKDFCDSHCSFVFLGFIIAPSSVALFVGIANGVKSFAVGDTHERFNGLTSPSSALVGSSFASNSSSLFPRATAACSFCRADSTARMSPGSGPAGSPPACFSDPPAQPTPDAPSEFSLENGLTKFRCPVLPPPAAAAAECTCPAAFAAVGAAPAAGAGGKNGFMSPWLPSMPKRLGDGRAPKLKAGEGSAV